MKTKNSNRILSVTIRRMIDDSPDTSWLGTYSNRPETEFAIDRAHSLDCASQTFNAQSECDCGECDCGEGGSMERNDYQFFNPATIEPFNPKAAWIPTNEHDKRAYWRAAMRENARRDYKRMESLDAGNWGFIGIRADAEIGIPEDSTMPSSSMTIQCITSGGLWGIESDSDAPYLESVEQEELGELKQQLRALGFGTRAISKAFQNVTRKNS